jgi:hydrogenase maturation factor
MECVTPLVQSILGHYQTEGVAAQAVAINLILCEHLSQTLVARLQPTFGWMEIQGRREYAHHEALLRELLREDIGWFLGPGFPLHVRRLRRASRSWMSR